MPKHLSRFMEIPEMQIFPNLPEPRLSSAPAWSRCEGAGGTRGLSSSSCPGLISHITSNHCWKENENCQLIHPDIKNFKTHITVLEILLHIHVPQAAGATNVPGPVGRLEGGIQPATQIHVHKLLAGREEKHENYRAPC